MLLLSCGLTGGGLVPMLLSAHPLCRLSLVSDPFSLVGWERPDDILQVLQNELVYHLILFKD